MRIGIKEILGRRAGALINGRVQSAPAVPPRVGAEMTIDQDRKLNYRADAVFARKSSLTDFVDTVDTGARGLKQVGPIEKALARAEFVGCNGK